MRLRFVAPIACAALATLVLATVLGDSGGNGHVNTPKGGFAGAAFPPGVRAHDFTLSDQQGRHVSLSAYRGEVVALAFLSSGCRACTLMAQQVRGALDELASRPNYGRGTAEGAMMALFVSTNPRTDTKASVKRFLADTSLGGRVLYLTGSEADLRPIWRAYKVLPQSDGMAASEAATTVMLIDRAGMERVAFGLEQMTPEGIAHDIRGLNRQADTLAPK